MPKINPKSKAIKEAKFIKALVQSSGNQTEAYKAIRPQVKGTSARALGSTELAKINSNDITVLYEKIGCDKYTVLAGLWDRMKADKTDYATGTRILSKIGGWEVNGNGLRDLLDRDLDLIEVVKIRLKKRSNTNDLRQVIDTEVVDNKSSDKNSDEELHSDGEQ